MCPKINDIYILVHKKAIYNLYQFWKMKIKTKGTCFGIC